MACTLTGSRGQIHINPQAWSPWPAHLRVLQGVGGTLLHVLEGAASAVLGLAQLALQVVSRVGRRWVTTHGIERHRGAGAAGCTVLAGVRTQPAPAKLPGRGACP